MFDVGVEGPLDAVLVSIRSVVAGADVGGLESLDAALVVERCAEAERLLAALRVLATATLVDKALWRRPRCPIPRSSWWKRPGSSPCEACRRNAAGWRRRRSSMTMIVIAGST